MTDDMQRVKKILNGTVIDHIAGGYALAVLEILGIKGQKVDAIISIAMNVNSNQLGRKDIVKIENRHIISRISGQPVFHQPSVKRPGISGVCFIQNRGRGHNDKQLIRTGLKVR